MRAERLLSLLMLLQTRGQQTALELSGQLEVSVRTVHRDVEALAAAGVPVEALRGPAGGYRLAGGYRTRLTGLTADEAEALFAAGMPGPAAELGLGGELAAARLKVLAALPAELQERATRAQRLFHLDTRGWFRAGDRVPHLPALAAAVWGARRVRLRYREGTRVVQRTVDPLGLVLKGGAWYLVARRSVGMRVYRVSRVVGSRTLPESFERPRDFELEAYWQEWSRTFEESRPRVEVSVRERDETRSLAYESFEVAYRELLRRGPDVEVLAPPELRARVADAVRATAAMYGR
ncbi:MAG TPA: WYL domain-containing protein [Gaiellaceae bacterium]|nr:WYL domain-containing protein [Gaiellaceae bacterium]